MEGVRIREARKERGLTQKELANLVGRSQAWISALERSKTEPQPLLRERIEAVLMGPPPGRVTDLREPAGTFRLPNLRIREDSSTLPVVSIRWQRPEASGDFFTLVPLPGETLLVAAVDVEGQGRAVFPVSLFIQGWLRGWLASFSAPPRLQTLVQEISRELRDTDLRCAGYFALLTPQPASPHTMSYEAMCFGFPPPLLLAGPPFQTLDAPEVGPPLPADPPNWRPPQLLHLAAPWRIVIASDGLLERLGGGDQPRGKRWLRERQTGVERDQLPDRYLSTESPPADDELFAALWWDGWDIEVAFSASDDAERHSALDRISHAIGRSTTREKAGALDQALTEAVSNARKHAYNGAPGLVRLRLREEEGQFRVEVQDQGRGGVTARQVARSSSGFAVMKAFCSTVEVRDGSPRGTVVTLVIPKG